MIRALAITPRRPSAPLLASLRSLVITRRRRSAPLLASLRSLAIATLLVGCKGQGNTFSCWQGKICENYTTDLATHEAACKGAGEWEKHPCPTEYLVGTCVAKNQQARQYYGGAANAYTSDTASAACEHELAGTWTSVQP